MCLCVAGKQTPLCYPNSLSSARAMMLFNLGSAYCLRSEYEKARKCLHQVMNACIQSAWFFLIAGLFYTEIIFIIILHLQFLPYF